MSKGYKKGTGDRSYTQNEHVRVAEATLGRKLGKTEIVHHVDEDSSNNSPSNLMVLRTTTDHRLIHSEIPVDVFKTSDGSHVVIKQQRECPHCNRWFEPPAADSVFCTMTCKMAAAVTTSGMPSREELLKAVWDMPVTSLCKIYRVSDTTVRNWCEKLNIERPPQGYWLKQKTR